MDDQQGDFLLHDFIEGRLVVFVSVSLAA